jgi:hypothetical protein
VKNQKTSLLILFGENPTTDVSTFLTSLHDFVNLFEVLFDSLLITRLIYSGNKGTVGATEGQCKQVSTEEKIHCGRTLQGEEAIRCGWWQGWFS